MPHLSWPVIGFLLANHVAKEVTASCTGTEAVCQWDKEEVAPTPPAGALLQKRSRAGAVAVAGTESEEAGLGTAEGRVIHFTISEEEFEDTYELIQVKLKAAGFNMQNFDPHFLTFRTRGGGKLEGIPKSSDFPLKFTYAQGSPAEEAAAATLVQLNATQGLWPLRDDTSQIPDGFDYTSTQEDLDMVALADHVYLEGGELPAGWKILEHIHIPSKAFFHPLQDATDRIALYSQGSTCVLAISGSDQNDIGDWLNNFNSIFTKSFCGRSWYHKGFVNELEAILSNSEFEKAVLPKAAECSRSGRLVIVGHSLGGAVATNLAECINAEDTWSWLWGHGKPKALRNFPRKEVWLYTFGAPATRRNIAASNDLAKDGVFKGKRFFAYDNPFCEHRYCAPWCCESHFSWAVQDPVPWVASVTGFWHPKIVAIGLDKSGKKKEYWKATNQDSYVEPDTFLPKIDPFSSWQMEALLNEHLLVPTYKPRLEKALAKR